MKLSNAKTFALGAVLGAIVGAAVLGPFIHVLLIGLLVAGVGALVYRGRRIIMTRADKRLEA